MWSKVVLTTKLYHLLISWGPEKQHCTSQADRLKEKGRAERLERRRHDLSAWTTGELHADRDSLSFCSSCSPNGRRVPRACSHAVSRDLHADRHSAAFAVDRFNERTLERCNYAHGFERCIYAHDFIILEPAALHSWLCFT